MNLKYAIVTFLALSISLSSCSGAKYADEMVDAAKYSDDIAKGTDDILDASKQIDDVVKYSDDAARNTDDTSDMAKLIDEAIEQSDSQKSIEISRAQGLELDQLAQKASAEFTLDREIAGLEDDFKIFLEDAFEFDDSSATEIAGRIVCEHAVVISKGEARENFGDVEAYQKFVVGLLMNEVRGSAINKLTASDEALGSFVSTVDEMHNKAQTIQTIQDRIETISREIDKGNGEEPGNNRKVHNEVLGSTRC